MPDRDRLDAVQNGVRIATSTTLSAVARLDGALRQRAEAALHWASLPAPADVRRLSARLAALHRAADQLR